MKRHYPSLRALGAALLYGSMSIGLRSYRDVFAFDPDEGINAMKALLLARGHALYGEVWSDQPPLFTWLLRLWMSAFGWDVDSGRALVVVFAALTVFAVYDLARVEAGEIAAVAACALLAASPVFARLSVSLMIGLPAVALATLAVWALFRWRERRRAAWLFLAGACMGASLATKLFTAVLLPPIALWIALCTPANRANAAGRLGWSSAPAALAWLLCTSLCAGALLLALVGSEHLGALVSTHLAARRDPSLSRFGAGGLLLGSLADAPLTSIGWGACILILIRRRWSAVVFPVWIAAATLGLLAHAPVWYHHQILLTVPYAATGGIAAAEMLRAGPGAGLRRAAAVAAFVAVLVWPALPSRLPAPMRLAGPPLRVLEAMRLPEAGPHVVLATDPMYAFRAGYETPPGLAVLSMKRIATDPRLRAAIDGAFARRAPDAVVLSPTTSEVRAWIRAAMGDDYRPLFAEAETEVLGRRDLSEPAPPARGSFHGEDR